MEAPDFNKSPPLAQSPAVRASLFFLKLARRKNDEDKTSSWLPAVSWVGGVRLPVGSTLAGRGRHVGARRLHFGADALIGGVLCAAFSVAPRPARLG